MLNLINDEPNHSGDRSDLRFGRDGADRIYIMSKRNGWIYRISDIQLPNQPALCNASELYQAENLNTNAGIGTNHGGYTGSGFVDYLVNVGNYINLDVEVDESCSYQLDLWYSAGPAGSATRTMNIYANAVYVETANFPLTSNWYTWDIYTAQIPLNQGSNTITIQYDNGNTGYINVDYMEFHCAPILASCNCNNAGLTCDDGDACTTNETYNANCNCMGGIFQDADQDGVCDANDVCAGFDDSMDDDSDGTPDNCDNCTLNRYIAQSFNNQVNQYAQNEIYSQQLVSSTMNIEYKAGYLINLAIGFEVEVDASFLADIETCF